MESDRLRIDPEGKYPSDGLRQVEARASQVLRLFPTAIVSRTRDVLQLDIDGEEGVVLIVTAESLEIRLPSLEWTMGAYGPAQTSQFWKRLKWDRLTDRQLQRVVMAGIQARQAEFAPCRLCSRKFPPEHRHGDVCHGCAEKHLGVVH